MTLRHHPVLCYHRIGGALELGVTRTTAAVFRRQMEMLAKAGWRTLRLSEFAESLRTTHHAPRTFLLTFDDGYASLADNAYPVLSDLGFTATTFVITDYIGKTNTWDVRYTWRRLPHLDWPTIESWRSRGFDFGSHGTTHTRLTWLSDEQVTNELTRSRNALLARLGPAAGRALAYPFGACDPGVRQLASAAGYELGFGGVRSGGGALGVPRVPVYVWDRFGIPSGLRDDAVGAVGVVAANIANRCAVGTSVMLALWRSLRPSRDASGSRVAQGPPNSRPSAAPRSNRARPSPP